MLNSSKTLFRRQYCEVVTSSNPFFFDNYLEFRPLRKWSITYILYVRAQVSDFYLDLKIIRGLLVGLGPARFLCFLPDLLMITPQMTKYD